MGLNLTLTAIGLIHKALPISSKYRSYIKNSKFLNSLPGAYWIQFYLCPYCHDTKLDLVTERASLDFCELCLSIILSDYFGILCICCMKYGPNNNLYGFNKYSTQKVLITIYCCIIEIFVVLAAFILCDWLTIKYKIVSINVGKTSLSFIKDNKYLFLSLILAGLIFPAAVIGKQFKTGSWIEDEIRYHLHIK